MKRKGLIDLGQILFSNVIKKKASPKAEQSTVYTGNWQFTDELSHRKHCLKITADLRILIDRRELAGQVESLTNKELVFLDGYGYHLRIDAVDGKPISVYDEADNRVYELVEDATTDTPKCEDR
ncbi:DUF4828 domain-containing protein [Ligilactobacillus apodemi]|uniref:DUF4828 domain-containing protein n=1 Tax=Ligilactobacillus apodemi DSM 16634 = JCM 16172 TaxID=1423724 RepID=A0A0R1TPU7_9LACO|nr:DUF4828 domain-containing protein [Ligilactobacillus apodemi]KRL83468.1 hypothetical protein FC32_GL000722 [Ligilactobacillus apodemi DSM 16634 = JCM 16172]MCR1901603.1 DUF4828 domain-containing protein [Ligilactobacillus apodemi]